MGRPSAIAPPFTFTFDQSSPSSVPSAHAWAANASMSSTRTNASTGIPVRATRLRTPTTGARNSQRVERGPERALDGFLLEDRLHHEVGLCGGTDPVRGRDPVRDLPRGRGIQPVLGDAPLQVAQDPRAARVCPGS
jgi:hypothetical protein